jgi:aspartate--ammonia ligase
MADKKADLAGPGVSTYPEVDKILPNGYETPLNPHDTQVAIHALKTFIMERMCKDMNLIKVECPLIVTVDSGVNDYLDRDGSRTPIDFSCGLGLPQRIQAQVVQAATKWKRMALKQFGCKVGEGINTDMRAVRKDYFLDHDHSSYVDQWDWEKVITPEMRTLDYLTKTVETEWKILKEAEEYILKMFPQLQQKKYPNLPDKLTFMHAEEILDRYPDLPRKQRETNIVKELGAIFIYGIGWTLKDGYPHEMRAADYDDWCTPTKSKKGEPMHGLNGDILVWNPVTQRRHELTSMGVRVTKETLKEQLKITGQEHFLKLPYHQAIINDELPLSIGGGIGQARTMMLLLKKAHLGEVTVTVWPKELKEICKKHNINVLE